MAKQPERDLGLCATITVSIGAMVGSGIFVRPGLLVHSNQPRRQAFQRYLPELVAF